MLNSDISATDYSASHFITNTALFVTNQTEHSSARHKHRWHEVNRLVYVQQTGCSLLDSPAECQCTLQGDEASTGDWKHIIFDISEWQYKTVTWLQ